MKTSFLHSLLSIEADTGGPARIVPPLCRELAALGAEVTLLSVRPRLETAPGPVVGGLSLAQARTAGYCGFRRRLRELCLERDVRLLHTHGVWLPCNHATFRVARRLRLPLVVTPLGMLEPWALRYKAAKKNFAWHLYQKRDLAAATVLHATSPAEAENLLRLGLRVPVAMIPSGVCVPATMPAWPLAKSRFVALFLSRIHPKKGLLDLVAAWARVRPTGWEAVIVGPDEDGHRSCVGAAVRAAGLEDEFRFVGSLDDRSKWDAYRQADLFVLPSYSESFGVAVAEAMAAGLPVITTTATPWQVLQSERCGWWIEPGSEPLATALSTATTLSAEERRAMGARGAALVGERFDWSTIARQMMGVYQWILDGVPRPACVHMP